ncbi:MAG: 4-alpha-glucanotransferase, partial [Akkermansiaceae bacterium]
MANAAMDRLRRLGVLIPVFSLRRDDDLGVGDTRALKEMVDWAVKQRVGFLQLLPINETGGDNSPYNAISSIALDPLLLDLEAIPEIGL